MFLKYCSITGPDDGVNPADLAEIAQRYPFVEWAIPCAPTRLGQPRYPTIDWIKRFHDQFPYGHKALHLNESALLGFVAGDAAVLELMAGFSRVQLNLKSDGVEGSYDPQSLANRVRELPQWEFILQYGQNEKPLLPLFERIPNHAILFDESVGRGISPADWPAPISGHKCGYAGGFGPANLVPQLDRISRVVKDQEEIWIDMESGVRTDNRLDLAKVQCVLGMAKPYASAIVHGYPGSSSIRTFKL